ncbi:hypothetical protein LCGC14_0442840 [marine sediment metagenome]|uniref:Uncharacterized protein n=1 Tax=marine sediment metagenome TaxID=412755 RepID=A0A0F9SR03_9ZZZZ
MLLEDPMCPKCSKTVSDCAETGCGVNFEKEGGCACRSMQEDADSVSLEELNAAKQLPDKLQKRGNHR